LADLIDTPKLKSLGREAAGGYISGSMDIAGGATDVAGKLPPAVLFKVIQRILRGEDPTKVYESLNKKDFKESVSSATDIPVAEDWYTRDKSKAGDLARAGGEGAAGIASIPSAVIGALSNIIAKTVSPDSKAGQFFINVLGNFGGNAALRGGRNLLSGAGAKPVPASEFPLSRSEATNSNATAAAESAAASSSAKMPGKDTTLGDAVAKWDQLRADKAKAALAKAMKVENSAAVGKKVADTYTSIKDELTAEHRKLAERDFGRAHQVGGDRAIVDLAPVQDALDTLIKKYGGDVSDAATVRKYNQLVELRSKIKPGQKATVQEVQNMLESYGNVAFGKGDMFVDLAPGSSVGDAKLLGGAWKDALNNTANSAQNLRDVAAAKALIRAKDNFASRLNTITDWAEQPIAKQFLETATTRPEDIADRLAAMTPTERAFVTKTLSNPQYAGTLDTIRKNFFNKFLESGDVVGSSARQPTFSLQGFLNGYESVVKKDPEMVSFLFPNPADKANFLAKVETVKKALTDAPAQQIPNIGEKLAVGGAQFASGYGVPGRAAAGAYEGLKMVFKDKNVVFNSLFNPEVRAKDLADNAWQLSAPVRYGKVLGGAGLQGNVAQQGFVNTPTKEEEGIPSFEEFTKQSTQLPEQPIAPEVVPTVPPTEPAEGGLPSFEQFLNTQKKSSGKLSLEDAVRKAESNGNPFAFNPKSGAMGADQIMPANVAKLGGGTLNPLNPDDAGKMKGMLLSQIKQRYGNDTDKILASYNWGQGNLEKYGMDKMPKETRDYIAKVKKDMGLE